MDKAFFISPFWRVKVYLIEEITEIMVDLIKKRIENWRRNCVCCSRTMIGRDSSSEDDLHHFLGEVCVFDFEFQMIQNILISSIVSPKKNLIDDSQVDESHTFMFFFFFIYIYLFFLLWKHHFWSSRWLKTIHIKFFTGIYSLFY